MFACPICSDHFTGWNVNPGGIQAGDPSAFLGGAGPALALGGRAGAPVHRVCGQRARAPEFQLKSYRHLLFAWNLYL